MTRGVATAIRVRNRADSLQGVTTSIVAALLVCGLVTACSAPAASPARQPAPSAGPTPTASVPPSPAATFTSADAGLRLTVTLDRSEVEPGGTVTAHLALTNDRPVAVAFIEPCGSGTMTVTLPVPLEPTGETWSGVKRAFKEYSLKSSQGSPMESSIRGPLPTYAQAGSCDASAPEGSAAGAVLAPGATYEADLMWTAELVRDLPATAGSMPFTVMVQHDVVAAGNGLIQYDTLEADGTITVLPGGRPPVSAGQALDVAIGDTRFAKWPASSCRRNDLRDILPTGATTVRGRRHDG